MTQNALSILGLGNTPALSKTALTPLNSGTSLPVDAIDAIDQSALDAALEFAALLLEQSDALEADGNPLPAATGNLLPQVAADESDQLLLEGVGEELLAQIAEVLPGISLPDSAVTPLPSDATASVLSLADTERVAATLKPTTDALSLSTPVLGALPVSTPTIGAGVATRIATSSIAVKTTAAETVDSLSQTKQQQTRVPLSTDATAVRTLQAGTEDSATLAASRAFFQDSLPAERRSQNALASDLKGTTPLPSTQATAPLIAPAVVQQARAVTRVQMESLQRISFADIDSAETAPQSVAGRTLQPPAPLVAGTEPGSRVVSLSLDTPFESPDFSRQFAERVGWVIHAKLGNAQIKINPEHLGPVDVSIDVDEQQARVQFVAAAPLTREAIESSLPRLRELLEQQGLQLADADVHDGSKHQQRFAESTTDQDFASSSSEPESQEQTDAMPLRRAMLQEGIIDTFV